MTKLYNKQNSCPMFLSNYNELTWEERTAHINLSTPCQLLDITKPACRERAFSKLLEMLELENDVEDRRKGPYCLHHCEHDSSHGWCINPLHISFGSASENSFMRPLEDRLANSAAAVSAQTPESRKKTVENTDYKLRAETYRKTRGESFMLETPEKEIIEVQSQRGVAEIIGCSRGAVQKALKSGHFGWKFSNWKVRRKS